MLSQLSLLGQTTIGPDAVEMKYGVDVPPGPDARNGVPLRPSEAKATDSEKAKYFTDSGRRFYEFDDEIAESLTELCGEAFEDHIKAAGF